MSGIYYKTKKTSETGKKVSALLGKVAEIKTQQVELEKKYDAKASYRGGDCLTGCVGFLFPATPDPKIWKKLKGTPDGFAPKTSTKVGKQIKKAMEAIPTIEREEIDKCIGLISVVNRVGFCIGEDCYGFSLGAKWNHEMPEDCKEITYTEYNNLNIK